MPTPPPRFSPRAKDSSVILDNGVRLVEVCDLDEADNLTQVLNYFHNEITRLEGELSILRSERTPCPTPAPVTASSTPPAAS